MGIGLHAGHSSKNANFCRKRRKRGLLMESFRDCPLEHHPQKWKRFLAQGILIKKDIDQDRI
jgi:hypothetical protein